MQTRDDIKIIRFNMSGSVKLDMERVIADPVWIAVSAPFDLDTDQGLEQALEAYAAKNLAREQLLQNCPATCGPADVYQLKIWLHKKKNPNSNAGSNTSQS